MSKWVFFPSSCPVSWRCRLLAWFIRCIFGMNPLLLFQKIEIIDDEESDMISNSEVDQMSSLLDYKVSNLGCEMLSRLGLHRRCWQVCEEFCRGLWEPAAPLSGSHGTTHHPHNHVSLSHLQGAYPNFSAEGGRKNSACTEQLCYQSCAICSSCHVSQNKAAISLVSKTKLHLPVPELFFGVLWHDFKCSMLLPALERDITAGIL